MVGYEDHLTCVLEVLTIPYPETVAAYIYNTLQDEDDMKDDLRDGGKESGGMEYGYRTVRSFHEYPSLSV